MKMNIYLNHMVENSWSIRDVNDDEVYIIESDDLHALNNLTDLVDYKYIIFNTSIVYIEVLDEQIDKS